MNIERDDHYWEIYNDRRAFLKRAKALINTLLQENHERRMMSIPDWEQAVVKKNIEQLTLKLSEVKEDLLDDNLHKYTDFQTALNEMAGGKGFKLPKTIAEDSLIFKICRYSVNYAVNFDLYWIDAGTIADHMDIALGKKPIDFLSGFCDAKLKDVREVTQPFLRQHVEFDFIQIVLDDLLKGFSDLQFVSTNILLHTIIEGVARAFCLQVYLHQHPDMNVKEAESILNNWPSLESLIVRQPWERDISITLIQAIILNEYINEPELNDATLFFNDQKLKQKQLNLFFEKLKKRIEDNPDIGKEELEQIGRELKDDMPCTPDQVFDIREERINVSLKVELQFLVRRHKDNRNKIIHGHFADFNTKWHCYLNLQALYRLGNVIRNYYEAMA